MTPSEEGRPLRLAAVPLCAGLVSAIAHGALQGWNDSMLFSGFLLGTIIGVVVGIPLLLRGDAKNTNSIRRHLLSAQIQALLVWLLSGASLEDIPVAIGAGILLGLLFLITITVIEHLSKRNDGLPRPQQGWVYAVPLSGGITLGAAAVLSFASPEERVPAFIFAFMVGGILSMLVGWPTLWLIERYLRTPLRYVAGGMITSLVIWVFCALPNLLNAFWSPSAQAFAWPTHFSGGAATFLLIGVVAGCVCTAINCFAKKIGKPTE